MQTVVAVFATLGAVAFASPSPDQITDLPGAPELNFKQYAGHITVNSTNNRELFYWFTESQNEPSKDPLILWLNGGPGCSSLGGLLSENGPFFPTADAHGALEMNPAAWNKKANVLYIESPAGVGFSFSGETADYTVGDKRTAEDLYDFLQSFFKMYPQFSQNEFWVSGESYGGHYVPDITLRIFEGNAGGTGSKINIQGFLVGNAWTVAELDNLGCVQDWFSHSILSNATYQGLLKNCDFANIGPLKETASNQDVCNDLVNKASEEAGNINIYQIYEDVCSSGQRNQATQLLKALASAPEEYSHLAVAKWAKGLLAVADKSQQETGHVNRESGLETTPPRVPCIDNFVLAYLNRPDVQAAIHANKTGSPKVWADCSSVVNYSYSDLLSSMLPIYAKLMTFSPAPRLLVYSGDVDGIVPTTGTRNWLQASGLAITSPWRPWNVGGQVGGYTQKYEGGLTFATVRGAGHMVPGTQPDRALAMLQRFVSGEPL